MTQKYQAEGYILKNQRLLSGKFYWFALECSVEIIDDFVFLNVFLRILFDAVKNTIRIDYGSR